MFKKVLLITALIAGSNAMALDNGLFSNSKSSLIEKESVFQSTGYSDSKSGPLDVEQAFQPDFILDNNKFEVTFNVQERYYIYKDKLSLKVNGKDYTLNMPEAIMKNDPVFGNVYIYEGYTEFDTSINSNKDKLDIQLKYQGCSDEYKICYPMETYNTSLTNIYKNNYVKEVSSDVSVPVTNTLVNPTPELLNTPVSKSTSFFDNSNDAGFIAKFIKQENYAVTLGLFLIFGILMAFTPCTFPMIPILSSIIMKHEGKNPLVLSSLYVIGIALCYASIGLVLKLFNFNIQILLQNIYLLVATSIVMFILALSMFGFINFRMPSFIQGKITEKASSLDKSNNPLSLVLSGFLSALILSPCAVAPLAGTLIFASQYDSLVYSTLLLLTLGIGSGIPLILWGTSFRKVMPKAGNWMYHIKDFIGVMLLVVGLYLLAKIIPFDGSSLTSILFKTVCFSVVIGYLIKFFDFSLKNKVLLFLITFIMMFSFNMKTNEHVTQAPQNAKLSFLHANTLADIKETPYTMVYVGADWCVSCKEMELTTYADSDVIDALKGYTVYYVDITDMDENKKEILKKYDLQIAPFYVLYDKEGKRKEETYIGYLNKTKFLEIIKK
jgi:thiol:disulfide interchange protein DsbD